MVEAGRFRLANEVCYIQRRAAEHDGRIVAVGQLVLFSTATGDVWLRDRSDLLARGSPEMARASRSTSRTLILRSPSVGRAAIASTGRRSFTRIGRAVGSSPSSDIRPTNSLTPLSREISNMFG
jgi:hypothetical protein